MNRQPVRYWATIALAAGTWLRACTAPRRCRRMSRVAVEGAREDVVDCCRKRWALVVAQRSATRCRGAWVVAELQLAALDGCAVSKVSRCTVWP